MDILQVLREDYRRFPEAQTYSIYARDVYFKDPVFAYRGLDRYRWMIGFIRLAFKRPHLALHRIERQGDRIETEWTLSWNALLPWQPRIAIDGWSELQLNKAGLIAVHIDYWRTPPSAVLRQHFAPANMDKRP